MSTNTQKLTRWQMISDSEFEAEAQRRGYKLIDLDDFEYEAHQDHNSGMHDDFVSDCPDCEKGALKPGDVLHTDDGHGYIITERMARIGQRIYGR